MVQDTSPTPGPASDAPAIGRRQQGLAERRRRLVRAAGELIVENEDGAFSMPELAKRAGLSLATPYNLFGSKAAVLSALFESQVRGFYRDNAWIEGASPVERIVGVVDRLVEAYSRQPRFFRNLRKALYGLGAGEHGQFPLPAGGHLVQPLVRSLASSGLTEGAIPLAALEATLMRIFNSVFEEWAFQDWPLERLRSELLSGFALVFYGFLGPDDRAELARFTQASA